MHQVPLQDDAQMGEGGEGVTDLQIQIDYV